MSLTIERAAPRDAEMVALLGRVTFRETFSHFFAAYESDLHDYLDRTFAVSRIRSSLMQERNRYWLVRLDGLPIGYAKLKAPSPTPLLNGVAAAELQKIYMLREFVGRGIGKPLLEAVIADARSRDIRVLWLDVLRQNHRAIMFYERRGFTPLGSGSFTIGAETFDLHLMVLRG
jgi:ribosomal protein S18 acetylase RimI-like enzyme